MNNEYIKIIYIEKQFVIFLFGICIDDNYNRLKKIIEIK